MGGGRQQEGASALAGHPPFLQYKLPRGRHGLSRDLVAESQRWRLLGAAIEILSEQGYARATSHLIAERAGVSRRTFYAHFDNLQDVLVTAVEVVAGALEQLAEGIAAGDAGEEIPPPIRAVASLLAERPALGRLLSLEGAAVGAAAAIRREGMVERLARLVEAGSEGVKGRREARDACIGE